MARYFFTLHDRLGVTPDKEGCDLPDAAAARLYATKVARDLMEEQIKHGILSLGDSIEVSNESGEVILMLRFSEAVKIGD